MKSSTRTYLPVLAAASALFFILNIWGYDLWPADEPRFAQVAREMISSGDYLAPHVNGLPYKEKPPLLFWSIAAASVPFGDVTEFSARVPSVIAAVVTVVVTFLLASRMYGAQIGIWAGIILATSSLFWWEARSVRTDMLLTAFMTSSLYFFWRWHESRGGRWLIAFYGAIAAGLLTKGPPALIFPILLIVVFCWKRREERRRMHYIIGLLAAVAVVLAWFIPARLALETPAGGAAVQGEFLRMTIGRLMGESKFQWPWYYLWNVPAGLLPWSLFLPWALPYAWRLRKEDDRMRLLMAWIVPAFIFFSACFGKRGVYLLPIYPAVAVISARAITAFMADERATARTRIAYLWGLLLIVFAVAPPAFALSHYPQMISQGTIIFALCAAGFGFATIMGARKNGSRNLHAAIAAQTAALCMLAAVGVLPPLNMFKGASDICEPLRTLSEKGVEYQLYTLGFSREEYIYYSKHFHTPVLNDLLQVELPNDMGQEKMVRQQRALRKSVAKAVEDVQIANIRMPSEEELFALRRAVHEEIQKAKADPELIPAFEDALGKAVAEFATRFEQPAPAFLFVQREDWKWLVALFPQFAQNKLISHESVGRREMQLIANPAGFEAVK